MKQTTQRTVLIKQPKPQGDALPRSESSQPTARPPRPEQFKTALLCAPAAMLTPEFIAKVRAKLSWLEIKTFRDFTSDARDWRKNLKMYIGQVEGLVIAIDDTRIIRGGLLAEVKAGWFLNRRARIFNVTTDRHESYTGFELLPSEKPGKPSIAAKLRVSLNAMPAGKDRARQFKPAAHVSPVTALSKESPAGSVKTRRLKAMST